MNSLGILKGLKRAFDDYVHVTGLAKLVGGQAQLASGLRLMHMEMEVIAIERLKAKERGVSMAEASLLPPLQNRGVSPKRAPSVTPRATREN